MARFDRYPIPSVFSVLSADTFVGNVANITNVNLTSVQALSVLNNPIIGLGVVGVNYVHTTTLTSVNISATAISTPAGTSDLWNTASSLVRSNSASWEESSDIIPTVTNYLSTSNVILSSLTTQNITITSSNVFSKTTMANLVSALAITVNSSTLYLPLLSAI